MEWFDILLVGSTCVAVGFITKIAFIDRIKKIKKGENSIKSEAEMKREPRFSKTHEIGYGKEHSVGAFFKPSDFNIKDRTHLAPPVARTPLTEKEVEGLHLHKYQRRIVEKFRGNNPTYTTDRLLEEAQMYVCLRSAADIPVETSPFVEGTLYGQAMYHCRKQPADNMQVEIDTQDVDSITDSTEVKQQVSNNTFSNIYKEAVEFITRENPSSDNQDNSSSSKSYNADVSSSSSGSEQSYGDSSSSDGYSNFGSFGDN